MVKISDKTSFIITGGASGLGRAIAERLAAEGARVVISDVDRVAGAATAASANLIFLEQDVCNEQRRGRHG